MPADFELPNCSAAALLAQILGEGQQGKRRKRGALPHLRARRPCAWVQRVSDDTSGP